MKNLLFISFLICVCFIESNGGIEKTKYHDSVAQDSTEGLGVLILNSTVLTSSTEDWSMVVSLIAKSVKQERDSINSKECVLFYNETRDTTIVREVNNDGTDETYKIFVKQ